MLIAFLALIALVNGGFGWVHAFIAWVPASLQQHSRRDFCAGRVAAGRRLERLRQPSAICWARAWC